MSIHFTCPHCGTKPWKISSDYRILAGNVLMCDGSVRAFSDTFDEKILQALATIDDGKAVMPDEMGE